MAAMSLSALYARYGGLVYRRARAILRDEQLASDVTQEVFLRALTNEPEVAQLPSPVAWLYRVTTNHCLNLMRDRKRRQELMDENPPAPAEVAPQPEMRLELARILERLPEGLREIAVYYYLDDMKQDEIAEVIGVSQRTISARLDEFRAAVADAADGPREEMR
jgi:RNA polymerase sigma factor (sigma-70 family)